LLLNALRRGRIRNGSTRFKSMPTGNYHGRNPMTDIPELFDKFGHFIMPSDEVIAGMEDSKRERFYALKDAAAASAAVDEELRQAEVNVHAAVRVLTDARAAHDKLHPPISAVQNAKDWIRSQRAEAQ
jgi:hypothetical protein